MVDKSKMTPEELAAYRKRVKRRAKQREQKLVGFITDPHKYTGEILQLSAHGSEYAMHECTGKIASCMRVGKPYERKLLEHIYQHHFSGVAVDAGAHIGNHTLWLAAICGLDVVAFEPGRFQELSNNIKLNDLGHKVTAHPFALSDRAEELAYAGKGKFRVGPEKENNFPAVPLDTYNLDNVCLMKIDVEGMEPQVLRGSEETIRRCRPVIFAEEWGKPEHDAIAAILEPWGYQMVHQFSGRESATPVGKWEYKA